MSLKHFFFCLLGLLLISLKIHAETRFEEFTNYYLTVNLNQIMLPGYYRCLLDKNNRIWVKEENLKTWQFPKLTHQPLVEKNDNYYLLEDYADVSYKFNPQTLSLIINTPISWLPEIEEPTLILANGHLRPQQPGLFLNYDVSDRFINFNNKSSYLAGLGEVGFFNYYGIGTTSFVGNGVGLYTQNKNFSRLESTWTLDKPESISTWRFGDSVSSGLVWSGAVRFGGIQYATNFNTQPTLVTFPQPVYRGEAVLPSVVDVFVNGAQNYQTPVERGPFYINQIPIITGEGMVQVVTTDMMGREQVVSFPFYAAPTLLKKGLSDYSYELGIIRNNYGIDIGKYGRPVAVGTYSLGISDRYTAGVHAEILEQQQTLGFNNNFLLGKYGVASLGAAASTAERGTGALLSLGFRRQTLFISYGFQMTLATPDYIQIGTLYNQNYPNMTTQSYFGISTENFGSLSFAYTNVKNAFNYFKQRDYEFIIPDANILLISYSKNLYKSLFFTIGGYKDFSSNNNNQLFASLVLPIDSDKNVSVNSQNQIGNHQENIQLSKNLPLGNGYGYHVLAANNAEPRVQGDFAVQNTLGLFGARYASYQNNNNYELNARGSIINFAHRTFLARHVDDAFALVHLPLADTNVYFRNQLVGKTNKAGDLYIPQLLAYQENIITIDPRDLPLNSEFPTVSNIVVPYYRSGALVNFAMSTKQNILLTLKDSTGKLLPSGAEVHIDNRLETFPVAYDGQAFLSVSERSHFHGFVEWDDRRCEFTLELKPSNNIVSKEQVLCH